MEIKGKNVLVTGGASGLGAATVRRLHGLGANVAAADMNREGGEALAAELGEGAAFVLMDVTNTEQVQAAVDRTMELFGGVHVLINCAGVGPPMKTVGKNGPHDLNLFKKVVEINLIGSFDAIRLAACKMQDNQPNDDGERGVIINTSSVAAFDGQMGQAAYAASKAALVGLTLPVARDLARSGIRVMTIAPGIFDTPLLASLPEEARISLGMQVPFPPRLGRPDEYAMLAQQIIENPVLNGETIRLDGAIRMGPK